MEGVWLGGGTTGNIACYHVSLFIENELLDYKASKGVIKFLIGADISIGTMTSVLCKQNSNRETWLRAAFQTKTAALAS